MSTQTPPPHLPDARGDAVRVLERFLVGPSGLEAHAPVVHGAAAIPHDLDARIPGLQDLRALTQGSPEVTVVILDGMPDLSVASLASDRISRVLPYWNARSTPITQEEYALFREISQSDAPKADRDQRFLDAFTREQMFRIMRDWHATHITSIIAGQPGTAAPGIAPGCRVIVVPLSEPGTPEEFLSVLNLARGFEYARALGADIIHCAACHPTQTDTPPEMLARAVQGCLDDGIMVVAPVGNNAGACRCIPAVLPGTLAVGALKADGTPFKFSNWGGAHSENGIMTLGTDVLGAQPGTDVPVRETGTSVSAPIITAISALMLSLQKQRGQPADGNAVRAALLETATPCVTAPERCLRGALNLRAATARITGMLTASTTDTSPSGGDPSVPNVAPATADAPPIAADHATASAIKQSTAHSGIVFGIGGLALGFETDAKRSAFEATMVRSAKAGGDHGTSLGNIHDVLDFLDQNPVERRHVVWLLEHDDAPIYALRPVGAYADTIYETLLNFLAGQNSDCAFGPHVERVSIPGRRTGRNITLAPDSSVPELAIAEPRGLFGWNVESLAQDAAIRVLGTDAGAALPPLQRALTELLQRIYFDLHNLGQTSRDRAMNFAATNCFQVASVLAEALLSGRVFENLIVTKSPLGRLRSDCWELSLTFGDPDTDHRAVKVFQFTVDVSDVLPVTVGTIRNWALRRDETQDR